MLVPLRGYQHDISLQSSTLGTVNPINTDTEGAIESVCINGLSVFIIICMVKYYTPEYKQITIYSEFCQQDRNKL